MTGKAQKIFDFNNGTGFPDLVIDKKVPYDNSKNKNVICLIGQARMGKSFFLNCFNTYLTRKTNEIFATASSLDHCTKDVYCYESGDYILLDCQGLKYENSKNDDKLLLIAYTLSDVVVINGVKTLDNTLFSYIEPISVYLHFLTNSKPRNNKPVLVFKIMDYQFEKDSQKKIDEQLGKLMKDSDDNYQTLRNTLKLLFKEVYATYTLTPDREEKKYFNNKNFNHALKIPELNFKGSIERIIIINRQNNFDKISFNDFIKKCDILSKDMSDRKNDGSFNMSECDLSKLTGEKRCFLYFNKIRDQKVQIGNDDVLHPNPNRSVVDTFTNLKIDDTTDFKIFIPQIFKIIDIIANFNNEFEDVDPNVVLQTYNDLITHLFSEIVPKLQDMKNLIIKKFKSININHIVDRFMNTYNSGISNYPSYSSLEKDINDFILSVVSYCNEQLAKYIYFSKFKKFKEIVSKIINNLSKKTTKSIEKHKHLMDQINEASLNFITLCNFDASVLIEQMHNSLTTKFNEIKSYHHVNILQVTKTKSGIEKKLQKYVKNKFVTNYILNSKLDVSMTYDQNIIEPVKKIILDDLKQSDYENIALRVISNVDISLEFDRYNISTKIITPYSIEAKDTIKSVATRIWNVVVAVYDTIKFNIYSSYYDKINFEKLFHDNEVKSTYISKIKNNISKKILREQISYDLMLKIREANKELKINFISFSNSDQHIHNLLRKKIVPNNGYLLLKDDIDNTILFDTDFKRIKIADIQAQFGNSNNTITFDFVVDPNSEDRFLKYNLQHIIMIELAKPNLFVS
jgi:hypothetical protein